MSEDETMTIDNYTKVVMTIIAGALIVIALQGAGYLGVQKVALCSHYSSNWCVSVERDKGWDSYGLTMFPAEKSLY